MASLSLCFRQLFFLLNMAAIVLCADKFHRRDFPSPPHFVFGGATSAYQVEGAAFEDGRTPSIWDTYAHAGYANGATGDVACDEYHKYKEDVQLMVETGLEAYRFSISWPRIIPNGRGPINPKGLQCYNHPINELIRHGIQPHVTSVHSDLPQALEDEYGGWLSQQIVKDCTAYVDVCFREFGDRVLHWTTFNEVNIFCLGRGNSSSEPYIAAHNILLAHASAARLCKSKYQPEIMKKNVGTRLPAFTKLEARQVKGSFDFLGLNHYNTLYIKDQPSSPLSDKREVLHDMAFPINPLGLLGVLEYFKQFYGNPPIYIHENGQQTPRNATLHDISRVKYLHGFIGSLLDAMRGYFMWSFLDVFEIIDGYNSGFGLYYVDLDDKYLKRYPKLSAHWYSNFLKGKNSSLDPFVETEKIALLPQSSHLSQ
ncbi:hypothetical protein NMG60_11035009 [Bertholletia excelsa]